MIQEPKKSKGGAGLGQGRKPTPKTKQRRPMSFRFTPWLAEWLRSQDDMTLVVERALINHYKLTPPAESPTSEP